MLLCCCLKFLLALLDLVAGALLSELVGADLVRVLKFPLLHKSSLADAEESGHDRGRGEHDAGAYEQHRSGARCHRAVVYIGVGTSERMRDILVLAGGLRMNQCGRLP
jgi:hypothetical protein